MKWKEKKGQRRKDGRGWEGEEKNWSCSILYIYVCEKERERKTYIYIYTTWRKEEGRKKEKRRRKTSTDDCRADVNWTVKRIRIEVDQTCVDVTNQLTNQSSQRRGPVLDRSSGGVRLLFVRDARTFHEMPCCSTPPCTFPLLSFFLYASPDFHSLPQRPKIRKEYLLYSSVVMGSIRCNPNKYYKLFEKYLFNNLTFYWVLLSFLEFDNVNHLNVI